MRHFLLAIQCPATPDETHYVLAECEDAATAISGVQVSIGTYITIVEIAEADVDNVIARLDAAGTKLDLDLLALTTDVAH